MTTQEIDDLIASGDLEPVAGSSTELVFWCPIRVPRSSVLAGGFELFAGAYGWKLDPDHPENNPIVASKKAIGKFVVQVVIGEVNKKAVEAASAQAAAMANALIGEAGRELLN